MFFAAASRWPQRRVPRARRGRHPRLERLEDRLAPAGFTVTTLADSGPGSLRAAVQLANQIQGADSIAFNLPAGPQTIALLSPLNVTDSLTVTGTGAQTLTIDGGGTTQLVNVSGTVNVTVTDLTLADGATQANGGAVSLIGGGGVGG